MYTPITERTAGRVLDTTGFTRETSIRINRKYRASSGHGTGTCRSYCDQSARGLLRADLFEGAR